MEKFGSMVHYVINEPLSEFNLRMQVRLLILFHTLPPKKKTDVGTDETLIVGSCLVDLVVGQYGRSGFLDPFRGAFRALPRGFTWRLYVRPDE
jgi:hypothetical protein